MAVKPSPKEWLDTDNLIKLQGWAREGLTDEQIAGNMGISPRTLYRWKKLKDTVDEKTGEALKYSQIRQTLKTGKESVDYAVENALLKAALSGNVTAMIFWLKNRRKEKWRDRVEYSASEEGVGYANNVLVAIRALADKTANDGVNGHDSIQSRTDAEAGRADAEAN